MIASSHDKTEDATKSELMFMELVSLFAQGRQTEDGMDQYNDLILIVNFVLVK